MTVTSASGSTSQPYAPGDTVRVRYDPARPERAMIVSFWTLWAAPTVLAVMGFGFIAPSVGVLVAGRRERGGQG